jgi:hypothetical protein
VSTFAVDSSRLARIQQRFAEFATASGDLPLYHRLAERAARDDEVASLLLVAEQGQARPVLWFAALHDLMLRHPDLPAARWYPSVVGADRVPSGDPWPDIRRTVIEHAADLRQTIRTHRTQTNEVNRAVYLAVGLALTARDLPERPLVLVELGASAGLLLATDEYRIELAQPGGVQVLGSPGSPVTCRGEDRSPAPLPRLLLPPVGARAGLDLAPVDLDDTDAVRWLEACIWPDVPGRVDRFRAAMALTRQSRPRLVAGDMVDDAAAAIEAAIEAASRDVPDPHVVVFSSWALSYVPRERRAILAQALGDVARRTLSLSWLTAEPVGCAPGLPQSHERIDESTTVLGARRWRSGRELTAEAWGTCHPHGAWVDLTVPPDLGLA